MKTKANIKAAAENRYVLMKDRNAQRRARAETEKAMRRSSRIYQEEREKESSIRIAETLKRSNTSLSFRYDELKAIFGDAPKQIKMLHDADLIFALREMYTGDFNPFRINELATWKPQGKGKTSILRSLTKHIFGKYKTAAFLLDIFSVTEAEGVWDAELHAWRPTQRFKYPLNARKTAVRIMNGQSLFNLVKSGDVPLMLTRQMCHDFLTNTTSEQGFIAGIRAAQMRAANLDLKFLAPWMNHAVAGIPEVGLWFFSPAAGVPPPVPYEDAFFFSVMQWFANHVGGMFDISQVTSILDYLNLQIRANRNFSMKGRTLPALLRDIETWHASLRKQPAGKESFPSCGFPPLNFQDKEDLWEIKEILGSKELHEEGAKMQHCVYSYKPSIARGATSIWTLRLNGMRRLTIEVDNRFRLVRQVRGLYNSNVKTGAEMKILQMWAGNAGLVISKYV